MTSTSEFSRLPRSLIPTHYALSLTPDLKAFTFGGHVKIDLDVQETSQVILLNAMEMTLKQVKLEIGGQETVLNDWKLSEENETLQINLAEPLKEVELSLHA